MKIKSLIDQLKEIIINKNNSFIKMIEFESYSNKSLIAAYDGILNTFNIININNKYDIEIQQNINNSYNKKIFIRKKNNTIIVNNILDIDNNKFIITAIYSNLIM
tara:strand:+ start:8524 stop:8838 length:315 start_codon:yes stop_codon:yes gene_type:complete